MEEVSAHPTAKPVAMVIDAILDVTKHWQVVLDTSWRDRSDGRTVRTGLPMDIDPAYTVVSR
jgi:hypothetical protein